MTETHPYDKGGIVPPGPTWVRNDSGEDQEVRPLMTHRRTCAADAGTRPEEKK